MFGITLLVWLSTFCFADTILTKAGLQGVYYLIHAAHNGLVVYSTHNEIWQTFTDFSNIGNATPNYYAAELVFALHIYHCIYYWRKFKSDDWLHHILMIAVALPIGISLQSGTLLGFSLFFTTGLPGGIDYFLLFLTRNNWLSREFEKRVNAQLAAWVRMPGCVAQAALTVAFLSMQNTHLSFYTYLAYLSALLNYWNGVYFGYMVIYDAGQRSIYGPRNLLVP
jgi:hypothetical protein